MASAGGMPRTGSALAIERPARSRVVAAATRTAHHLAPIRHTLITGERRVIDADRRGLDQYRDHREPQRQEECCDHGQNLSLIHI